MCKIIIKIICNKYKENCARSYGSSRTKCAIIGTFTLLLFEKMLIILSYQLFVIKSLFF